MKETQFRWIAAISGISALSGVNAYAFPEILADGPYRKWRLGLSVESVSNPINLKPMGGAAKKDLKLRPSESRYLGLILGYRWLKGTIVFPIPSDAQTRNREGVSQYRDLRVSNFDRVWGFEALYSRYRGYLIEGSENFSATALAGNSLYRLPEMRSKSYSTNIYFVLTPEHYRLSSAVDQSEPIAESGGSFLLISSLQRETVKNSSAIIPAERQDVFGEDADLNLLRVTKLSSALGYGGVYKGRGDFFASGLFAFGAGPQKLTFGTLDTGLRRKYALAFAGHAKAAIGVNGDSGFLKVMVSLDHAEGTAGSVHFENQILSYLAMAGYRF